MFPIIRHLYDDERGATSIEYALIAMLISVFIIAAATSMAVELGILFTTVETAVAAALTKA